MYNVMKYTYMYVYMYTCRIAKDMEGGGKNLGFGTAVKVAKELLFQAFQVLPGVHVLYFQVLCYN